MATLQEAIDQIQDIVGAISGIKSAPHEPPEKLSAYPFAVAYLGTGEFRAGPGRGAYTGEHSIILELHVARKNLAYDVARAMAYAKSIPNALFDAHADGTFTAFGAMVGPIRYEFGPLGWGGAETIGFRFTIEGVSTRDTIS